MKSALNFKYKSIVAVVITVIHSEIIHSAKVRHKLFSDVAVRIFFIPKLYPVTFFDSSYLFPFG